MRTAERVARRHMRTAAGFHNLSATVVYTSRIKAVSASYRVIIEHGLLQNVLADAKGADRELLEASADLAESLGLFGFDHGRPEDLPSSVSNGEKGFLKVSGGTTIWLKTKNPVDPDALRRAVQQGLRAWNVTLETV